MKKIEIISRFEQYIRYKASSPSGRLWLESYRQRRGLNTLILIIHFLQDEDWVNTALEPEQETELYAIYTE